jgi:6-phosphogluconolactonase
VTTHPRGERRNPGGRRAPDGTLEAIPGSTRALPGGSAAAPTDVRFSEDGTRLLVTESGTNQIDVFEIGDDGLTGDVVTQPSSGIAPFGLRIGEGDLVVVAEAMSAAASSYRLDDDGTLDIISASVPNGQAASCWISLANRYAYISNTAASTLSSYRVADDGTLTLLKAVAVATGAGSAPIDSALSRNSKFLYVVDSTLGRVLIFRVAGADLVSLGNVTGLPTSVQGIAAQ